MSTTTDSSIERFINDELLTGKHTDSDIYAGAAEYLLFQGENLMNAIALANSAIQINENNGWARSLRSKYMKG